MLKKICMVMILMLMFITVINAEEGTSETTDEDRPETTADNTTENNQSVTTHQGSYELPELYGYYVSQGLEEKSMPIDILVKNQENISFLRTDVDAMIINNTTYVPLRALTEAFYMSAIQWDGDNYKAVVGSQLGTLEFLINKNEVIVSGEVVTMDTPSLIVDSRTMVPLRFISELFGFMVEWDPTYYTVTLSHEVYEVNAERLENRFYSFDELTVFSKLIMREAGSVSYETKHGVASVVMNHLRHDYFEDTISGVIYATHNGPHFPPAHKTNFLGTVPNYESVLAAKKTLRGENSVETCIYFNTKPFKGKSILKVVDGVYFCYD